MHGQTVIRNAANYFNPLSDYYDYIRYYKQMQRMKVVLKPTNHSLALIALIHFYWQFIRLI